LIESGRDIDLKKPAPGEKITCGQAPAGELIAFYESGVVGRVQRKYV
jgi:hypothetical protein